MNLTWKEFERVEMRTGTIIVVSDFLKRESPLIS
jgi:hypothetical protein